MIDPITQIAADINWDLHVRRLCADDPEFEDEEPCGWGAEPEPYPFWKEPSE